MAKGAAEKLKGLSNLANAGQEAESKVTGAKKSEETEQKPDKKEDTSKKSILSDKDVNYTFNRFFEDSNNIASLKKDTCVLDTEKKNILKLAAQANNSSITVLLDNIITSWVQQNKEDIEKSIKSLYKGLNL